MKFDNGRTAGDGIREIRAGPVQFDAAVGGRLHQDFDGAQRFRGFLGQLFAPLGRLLTRRSGQLHNRPRFGHERQAGQGFEIDAAMGVLHDVMPGRRRQGAAGHIFHRLAVVIAIPDDADEIAGIAAKPGVLVFIGRAGLARDLDAVERGAAPGALLDNLRHHPHEIVDVMRFDHLLRLFAVAVVGVDRSRRGC